MEDVQKLKTKLQQKKNRIAAEEIRLNLKERKMRTRHLIELGGLVVKASLDHLPTNTIYGALLSLKDSLMKDEAITKQWTLSGKKAFDQEEKSKIAVILKLTEQPSLEIRATIRNHGLKWNRLREEWYGYVQDLGTLKENIATLEHDLQIIG